MFPVPEVHSIILIMQPDIKTKGRMAVASMFCTSIANLTYFSPACHFFLSLFCCPIICADLRGTALCRASLHPPPLATPRVHSVSQPHPQRSTEGDVRSKETLHCCRVTSWCSVVTVLIQRTQDSTYLLTILAQSQSQTGWVPPPPPPLKGDHHYVPQPILLCKITPTG